MQTCFLLTMGMLLYLYALFNRVQNNRFLIWAFLLKKENFHSELNPIYPADMKRKYINWNRWGTNQDSIRSGIFDQNQWIFSFKEMNIADSLWHIWSLTLAILIYSNVHLIFCKDKYLLLYEITTSIDIVSWNQNLCFKII